LNKLDTVLIVEDEDILRNVIKLMLEGNGIKVLTAVDGIEAVEVFTENKDKIGVVLSDLGLPRLGGWDASLKMREINPQVKLILASGYYNAQMETQILQSGANYFVTKPYNPPELLSLICRLLKGEEQ
jgi:two-component system cell cycle sensor histidine kinase/response regulator CckA